MVWSTGAKSLILWDAYTGAYLGSVSRSSEAELERESQRFRYENSERDERYVPRLQIDHRRVTPPPLGLFPPLSPAIQRTLKQVTAAPLVHASGCECSYFYKAIPIDILPEGAQICPSDEYSPPPFSNRIVP